MECFLGRERRDPLSWVYAVGATLVHAAHGRLSGELRLTERCAVNCATLVRGAVAAPSASIVGQQLFAAARPRVEWHEQRRSLPAQVTVDARLVLCNGLLGRAELFDPRRVAQSACVATLHLDRAAQQRFTALGAVPEVEQLMEALIRPTPVPFLLWKRGLDPSRAAALLVALNLLGAFEPCWPAGHLPRQTRKGELAHRLAAGCADHELLGVSAAASAGELARAFRALAREVHPDRMALEEPGERQHAEELFRGLSAAYERLQRGEMRIPPRPDSLKKASSASCTLVDSRRSNMT